MENSSLRDRDTVLLLVDYSSSSSYYRRCYKQQGPDVLKLQDVNDEGTVITLDRKSRCVGLLRSTRRVTSLSF